MAASEFMLFCFVYAELFSEITLMACHVPITRLVRRNASHVCAINLTRSSMKGPGESAQKVEAGD